ncbi:proline-rich receptor-like protein kinase PERK1 [Rosa rugosa]|uniref:proline-rich receptor-like protein kinase PERK1 n=1 Tax=Rosa rugosa TaxID=74645 RepID=UPI002B40E8F9|nr:proline-rich receptor-like protein kinase PERK1 [Rosa rugosa]
MSSPPWSLPSAAVPVTTPPPLPPSQPPALPPLSPQSPPFVSPLFPPTSLPALPPVHNSIPPVSSPLPSVVQPPPPPVTSPPPPSVTSPPPPSLTFPPPTPLPSRPSPPPPPQPTLSPPPLPTPKTPYLSPPTKPLTSPPLPPPSTTPTNDSPPPTLSTPLPPVTTTTPPPPLATPSNSAPPPDLATLLPPVATSPKPPPTLARTLPPSPSNAVTPLPGNAVTPLPTTTLTPPPLIHSPSPSLLPATLQVQKPQPKAAAGLVAGCVIVGVVVVFLLLGIVLICYKRRSRKNNAIPEDYYKPPSLGPKDGCYDAVQPHHNVPQPGVHVIRVLSSTSTSPMRRAAGSEVLYAHQPQWLGFPMDISNGTFTYDQLLVATNGFSEANLLGQGGFGYVHKGVLPGGKEVAVKQLKTGSRQGEREFHAEVDIISLVHHKHLVSLVGHCIKGAERLLVYEFVPNNTLEFHLHGLGQTVLEWEIRLKIATGSAKGLAYLHEDCNPKIIHRDIKASNILVDQKFEAKVSDFGLAKSFSGTNTHITHLSTRVVGTFGYLAPEYASSGKVTEKSDVYSYGVVLLELITGRPPISTIDSLRNEGLVQWARPLLTQALEDGAFDALVDPRLETNYNKNEMARMVACAAACVRHSAWLRPRMSQIVHALEGVASLMDLQEGVTPGNSAVYNCLGNSHYNSRQYEEDLKNSTVTMPSQEYGISRYTETTSEYGLNPSGSSSETRQTI